MYYNINTHEIKNSIGEIRKANPNVSLPKAPTAEQLLELGEKEVFINRPSLTTYQIANAKPVELIEGVPTLNYDVIDLEPEDIKNSQYRRLEKIFNAKTTGLKSLAIDRPRMTDPEAINNQYRVYEEMYKNAIKGLYDAETNNAIIIANEGAKTLLAPLTLLLNQVRGVLESLIEESSPNADTKLDYAENIHLTREGLTEQNISAIRIEFAL